MLELLGIADAKARRDDVPEEIRFAQAYFAYYPYINITA